MVFALSKQLTKTFCISASLLKLSWSFCPVLIVLINLSKLLGVDVVVDNAVTVEKMLDNMIEIEKQHLGYLI